MDVDLKSVSPRGGSEPPGVPMLQMPAVRAERGRRFLRPWERPWSAGLRFHVKVISAGTKRILGRISKWKPELLRGTFPFV